MCSVVACGRKRTIPVANGVTNGSTTWWKASCGLPHLLSTQVFKVAGLLRTSGIARSPFNLLDNPIFHQKTRIVLISSLVDTKYRTHHVWPRLLLQQLRHEQPGNINDRAPRFDNALPELES